MKEQIRVTREPMDNKECDILQKTAEYQPIFSRYLTERKKLISKTMSLKARRKAGMPIGTSGKPVRPYTNASEAINNVMLQTKESYLRDKKKPETAKLSKL